jgi:hypothetical protein
VKFRRTFLSSVFIFVILSLVQGFISQPALGAGICDVNEDGYIDRDDINLIVAVRNTPASGPDDTRDADGDGIITVLDARRCILKCTLPRCAIVEANQPPVANAGEDQNVIVGEIVTLNGQNSYDPDGDIITYYWNILSLPSDSTVVLDDPASVTPTFVPDFPGDYIFSLTVNDGKTNSNPDTVTITVGIPIDSDNDGYSILEGDCDDNNPLINPGMKESCNGIDDNCNKEIDEGVLNACGKCGPVPDEVCDGVDNDCDELIDEGFDSDGDNIADCFDNCPGDPDNDLDNDGVCGDIDQCPGTPSGEPVDINGCSESQLSQPLTIEITEPSEGEILASSPIVVRGTLSDPDVRVMVQNVIARVSGTTFEAEGILLTEGLNELNARAQNDKGEEAFATRSVILDTTPPGLTITSPAERSIFTNPVVSIYGIVEDATAVTGMINNTPVTIKGRVFSGTVTLEQGKNIVNISCQDAADNFTDQNITLYLDTEPLTITNISPSYGATDVDLMTAVSVTFSEPVNTQVSVPLRSSYRLVQKLSLQI